MINGIPSGTLFGSGSGTEVVQHSFQGQPDWFAVPTSWFTYSDANQQIWASPNSDFSPPLFAVKINLDGFYVYQDLMRSRISGTKTLMGSP